MKAQKRSNISRNQSLSATSCPDDIHQIFFNYPSVTAKQLLQLRKLIIQVHNKTDGAGELVECLRWGQPSYITKNPVTGTAIRLGIGKCGRPALFFHCRTTLIDRFKSHYLPLFDFEGNRALVLKTSITSTKAELAHCIREALTYKLK